MANICSFLIYLHVENRTVWNCFFFFNYIEMGNNIVKNISHRNIFINQRIDLCFWTRISKQFNCKGFIFSWKEKLKIFKIQHRSYFLIAWFLFKIACYRKLDFFITKCSKLLKYTYHVGVSIDFRFVRVDYKPELDTAYISQKTKDKLEQGQKRRFILFNSNFAPCT